MSNWNNKWQFYLTVLKIILFHFHWKQNNDLVRIYLQEKEILFKQQKEAMSRIPSKSQAKFCKMVLLSVSGHVENLTKENSFHLSPETVCFVTIDKNTELSHVYWCFDEVLSRVHFPSVRWIFDTVQVSRAITICVGTVQFNSLSLLLWSRLGRAVTRDMLLNYLGGKD